MPLGIDDVRRSEAERVNGRVGHPDGTDEGGVDGWLNAPRLFRRDDVGTDAGAMAGLDKILLIVKTVFGERDEKAVGLFHTMTCHTAERHVFLDTFACRLLIGDGVACAAMKQTMVAAGRTIGEVVLLNEKNLHPAACTIACRSRSRDTTTDDDHIIFVCENLVHHIVY